MNKRKYLTETEIKKIINEAYKGANPERDRCLIWMCFIHGCRVSEIRHWRLSDHDLHNHSIYVKRLKNGFSTTHPLFSSEMTFIREWLSVRKNYRNSDSDWLFLSQKGTPLSRQRIHVLISHYSQSAGLRIAAHPHMLRHACGFSLADKGMDTRLIQDYLGHRNIQHTVLYTASNAARFKNIW